MNKYKCKKCNKEFECKRDPRCPKCGANNFYSTDCELIQLGESKEKTLNILHSLAWPSKDLNIDDIVFDDRYDHLD